ncbi:SDR family NAD(P)-dependent oxidoreductase [Histidinibacterium aquaticum]|uniref:SDR family NAD(P)-dependent oxidoreductase n=1 Tax=Histidinibacterium aquaticum TaxID=2613962 RepID=A0A5J5GJZ0_9RHOB|nr:SDR family NAD(P)-dependent oxidoreductase [Histidinibacterium aquaticum]KAA9007854.1 SDR family NAD(P)-dependent oxidoreductase [Histidinibacterium aquaticum]
MEIAGQHILVTGAASGLGAATARELASAGAAVTVLDRSAEAAERMAEELGGRAIAGDVTDPEIGAQIDGAIEALGPLRGLVNCAGIGTAARIAGREGPMPLEDFERVIRVNLVGTFNMLRLAADRMTTLDPLPTGERGAVVNTASVAAQDGQIGQAAYAASKGGIVSLALPAARELARFGIRVNTVAPGIFRTPLLEELPEEVQRGIAASIPFPQRLGEPEEFARTVRFCLENAYLNAEVIRLDGAVRLPPK